MIPEAVASVTAGIFFGAALYINLVEQLARLSGGVAAAVTEAKSYRGCPEGQPLINGRTTQVRTDTTVSDLR